MNDVFTPVLVPSGKPVSNDLRYNVKANNGVLRLSLLIPADIYKRVKPVPKGWRLDVNRAAGKARISALIQMDGSGCKKHKERDDDKSICLNYGYARELPDLFPEADGETVGLENVEVTSMGIVFDLPGKREAKPAKGK